MRQLLLFVSLSVLLSGCILSRRTNNEPVHQDRISALVPGKTTAREAVEILGAPTEVVQLGKRTAYRYDHTVTKDAGLVLFVLNVFNSDTRADRAWVFFDERETLTHIACNLHAIDASYALPWQSVRDRDDEVKTKPPGN